MSRTVNTMMNHYIRLKLKVFGDSKLSISKSNMSLKYLTSLASFPSYYYAKEYKLLQSAINPQQNDLDVVKEGKSQIGDKDCASY